MIEQIQKGVIVRILKLKDNWVTAIISNRWVQAKVFDLPSEFGVNGGRVSKIAICKTNSYNKYENFFDQLDYHYDRGLDYDGLPPGVLDEILNELEGISSWGN